MMVNRNKRAIAVNLKAPEGQAVLRRLLADADIVIENYRQGTMERLGLGYEALRQENPGLIYVELSGFGRSGPYAERGGFDLIAQGMSGLMSITGEGHGRPPVKVGAPVSDVVAGILGALGAVSALQARTQTGRGQRVDTSLFEAAIVQTYWQSAIAFATGGSPGPLGSAHPLNAPYQAFATADGYINVGAANQANWLRLLEALGAQALAEDSRFADNKSRMAHLDELVAALEVYFKTRTTADWLAIFEQAGFPAGPVLSVGEMHRDPQALAREMVVDLDHPSVGAMKTLGLPIKLSDTPGGVTRPAPLYGQHSREVLREIGFDAEEIARLLADGVLVAHD